MCTCWESICVSSRSASAPTSRFIFFKPTQHLSHEEILRIWRDAKNRQAIRADEVLCLGRVIPALSPSPLLLLGSNIWKEKENTSFSLNIFIAFYYWRTAVCVFLFKMIGIDMFNNVIREQRLILEVKPVSTHVDTSSSELSAWLEHILYPKGHPSLPLLLHVLLKISVQDSIKSTGLAWGPWNTHPHWGKLKSLNWTDKFFPAVKDMCVFVSTNKRSFQLCQISLLGWTFFSQLRTTNYLCLLYDTTHGGNPFE